MFSRLIRYVRKSKVIDGLYRVFQLGRQCQPMAEENGQAV